MAEGDRIGEQTYKHPALGKIAEALMAMSAARPGERDFLGSREAMNRMARALHSVAGGESMLTPEGRNLTPSANELVGMTAMLFPAGRMVKEARVAKALTEAAKDASQFEKLGLLRVPKTGQVAVNIPTEVNRELLEAIRAGRVPRSRVGDVIHAPELRRHAKDVLDLPIEHNPELSGMYLPHKKTIYMGPQRPEVDTVDLARHEIGHGAAHLTGLPAGGNLERLKEARSFLTKEAPTAEITRELNRAAPFASTHPLYAHVQGQPANLATRVVGENLVEGGAWLDKMRDAGRYQNLTDADLVRMYGFVAPRDQLLSEDVWKAYRAVGGM
jgi:hypothetical protein